MLYTAALKKLRTDLSTHTFFPTACCPERKFARKCPITGEIAAMLIVPKSIIRAAASMTANRIFIRPCPGVFAVFDEDADALREAINGFLAELSKEDRLIFMGRYFDNFGIFNKAFLCSFHCIVPSEIDYIMCTVRTWCFGHSAAFCLE